MLVRSEIQNKFYYMQKQLNERKLTKLTQEIFEAKLVVLAEILKIKLIPECPKCKSTELRKKGLSEHSPKQQYLCNKCNNLFFSQIFREDLPQYKRTSMRGIKKKRYSWEWTDEDED